MTTKETVITALIAHVTDACDIIDTDAAYDSMLDECYSFDSVGGPFASMCASAVLKEVDPIAYRCGKVDYIDGEEWVEIEGEYYDKREVDDAQSAFVSDLEDELTELESEKEALEAELEEIESGEDYDEEAAEKQKEIDEKEHEIADKEAEIKTARDYTF